MNIRAGQALKRFLDMSPKRVLDIGCGDMLHTNLMRDSGCDVTTIDFVKEADVVADYADYRFGKAFDGIWCSHVLEHQVNVGFFLRKLHRELKDNGALAITVPPCKKNIVGGHVTLWNAGLLLYNLILAGFDCSEARVGQYGYNISVVMRKKTAELPLLTSGKGDIEALSRFFPVPVKHGFNGQTGNINW